MVDMLHNIGAGVEGTPVPNRAPQVVAGSIILIVIPTITVFLRLLSRRLARASLWWDDYAVILALVFSWGPNILNIVATNRGFGKHIYNLEIGSIHYWFKCLWAFEIIYFVALVAVKYSIILFQYRVFPIVHYRRILIGCMVFVTCWFLACLFVAIFNCVPVSDFWNKLVAAQCISVPDFFSSSGGINAATNFFLLAMPIPLLWKLKTGTLQKLVLTFIFTIGLVVCVVSVVRLILLSKADINDITWNYVPVTIWTAAEPSIGVVSASLPSLRPLFARMIWWRSPKANIASSMSSGTLTSSWHRKEYSGDGRGRRSSSFNRLRDNQTNPGDLYPPWTNKSAAYGGHHVGVEEYDIEGHEAGDRRSMIPVHGIRVRTTVTVTEKVDWQCDLF